MVNTIQMQEGGSSRLNPSKLCSYNLETIEDKTTPLIHQAARFWLINNGEGKVLIQSKEYRLCPGAFVAILPWHISEIIEVTKPLQYSIVAYHFEYINYIIKSLCTEDDSQLLFKSLSQSPVVYLDNSEYLQVKHILSTLKDEVGVESTLQTGTHKPFKNTYIASLMVQLLVYFSREVQGSYGNEPSDKEIHRADILSYMYNHLSEKLTLKMLSRIFYMSESSISQYITQVTGLSFFDLLNEMRIGKTISFLLYTDFTLDELSEILGYVDASHISKVFLSRVGMRANEYRKTYQKAGEICNIKESRKAYSIINYIYRSYSESLKAKLVAEQFQISVDELNHIFLYQVEKNFDDFLNSVRINNACKLLLETDKSITDIAIEVGYNTSKTFKRNFLRLKVMTPSKFRETITLQQTTY